MPTTSRTCACRSRCAATGSPRPTCCWTGSQRSCASGTRRSPGCAGTSQPSPRTKPSPTRPVPPTMTADLPRCGWADSAPEYVRYHDEEWGTPQHGDTVLFERLALEGFQSGLSWLVILRKRPAFRAAFAGFDIATVARFGDADVARLLADPGIVRNRAKISATISN